MKRRLLAFSAHLGILAILVAAPTILWLTIPAVPRVTTWPQLGELLASRDDGSLALAAIWLVALVCWGILTALIVAEGIAILRGTRMRRLPGLAVPQHLARQLIATAALLYLANATSPTPTSAPVPAAAPAVTAANPGPPDAVVLAAPEAVPSAPPEQPHTVTHVVKQGESLWRIAESHLGSGRRYREIIALNRDLLSEDPDFLKPGWILRIPAPTPHKGDPADEPEQATTYLVRKGDTLSQIAEDYLGSAHRWSEIAQASAHVRQPGGRHLTDPDEIDIGWTLIIPRHLDDSGGHGRHDPTQVKTPDTPVAKSTPTPARPSPASTATESEPASTPSQAVPTEPPVTINAGSAAAPTDGFSPGWLIPGLTAGGLVLAGSLWLVLRARRATQFRHRRPGRMITAPPPDALPAEKTLLSVREPAVNQVAAIHNALLGLATQLADPPQPMPQLVALGASHGGLTLRLAEQLTLPAPWKGDGLRWSIPLDEIPNLPTPTDGAPPPYPLLVTVGVAPDGTTWLCNVEQFGTLGLAGNPDGVADLLRYLCAEIAVNPWSRDATAYITTACSVVQQINPQRVRASHEPRLNERLLSEAIQLVDRATEAGIDLPTARARQAGADLWPAALLVRDATPCDEAADELQHLAQSHPARAGITLLTTGDEDAGTGIRIDDAGNLTVPGIEFRVRAVALTPEEAAGCAALLAAASQLDDQPIAANPASESSRQPTDSAGAILVQVADQRPPFAAAGSRSLLPEPDDHYLAAAATTAEDLRRLAPPVADRISAEILALDPQLDDDLNLWFSDDCPLPRLSILGPVTAQCGPHGRQAATNNHLGMLTEILIVLATRPHGATVDELAEAVAISPGRVRKEVMLLREWLGTNPRSGRPHVPDARQTKTALATGTPVYEVEDILIDASLFTRLRTRAQARGQEGIADLRCALRLVQGEPLTRLRNGSWLDQGERLDLNLTCAIIDVAHIVATHALAADQLDTAREAAETACRAAPFDDTPRLDLAAVAQAEGHSEQAQRIVADSILNRDEDEDSYPDLSGRSDEIINRHGWRPARRRAG